MSGDGGHMYTTTEAPIHPPDRRPSHRDRPRRLAAVAAILVSAVVGLGAAAATPASASPACHVRVVRGTFVDGGATLSNIQPSGDLFTFDITGGTQLTGDLTGSTTYSGSGTVDLANDKVVFDLHETFTGSIKGIGTGTVLLLDHVVSNVDGTSGQIGTIVASGTGGLAHVRGLMGWSWTTRNADGSIPGEYHGLLIG
jgi:Protein of unknown function (DUF3224)